MTTIVVASNNGLIKVIETEKQNVRIQWGEIKVENEIDALIWGRTQSGAADFDEVIAAFRHGAVRRFDTANGQLTGELSGFPAPLRGLALLPSGDLFSCMRTGEVWLRDFDDHEAELPEPIYQAGAVERARLTSSGTHFAYGGHENLVQYIDLETQTRIWDARNVPHDELDMRVPVWVKDLVFDPTDDRKIITSTHYHQVRLYDTNVQRRPIFSLEVGECPLNCIVAPPVHGGHTVVVGDTQGNVTMIDLRKRLPYGRYKGNAGSIRSVTAHPTQPVLGVCGLDRHARIYNLNTRKPIAQLYLKTRLNHILIADEPEPIDDESDMDTGDAAEEDPQIVDDEAAESSEDEMWSSLAMTERSDDEEEEEEDNEQETPAVRVLAPKKQRKSVDRSRQSTHDPTPARRRTAQSSSSRSQTKSRSVASVPQRKVKQGAATGAGNGAMKRKRAHKTH